MSIEQRTPCLIDSNVLVYMLDTQYPELQQVAIRVYQHLLERRRVVLSAQCLTEFLHVVTRRLSPPVPIEQALLQLDRLKDTAIVHPITADVVIDAAQAMANFKMSMWDALIWAVAHQNNVPVIVTEDMQSQPTIGGIQYINPFAPNFNIQSL